MSHNQTPSGSCLSFLVPRLEETLLAIATDGNELSPSKFSVKGYPNNELIYDVTGQAIPEPHSPEFRQMVLDLYEKIAKRSYDPKTTELAEVDLVDIDKNSFPFSTGNPATVSMYFYMLAATFRTLRGLVPGMSILEFGPGWGETTLALARLGFDVTCIEINPSFISLIKKRAEISKVSNIRTLEGDFSIAFKLAERFDVILFFESFHHAFRHDLLLGQCVELLKPNGQIIFSGEPIMDGYPIPWGLRLDAQSLFCTAQYGWMELGFSSEYFRSLLRHHGLVVIEQRLPEFNFFKTYSAAKCLKIDFATAPLGSQVGVQVGTGIKTSGVGGVLIYGPYWKLERGHYAVRCDFNSNCGDLCTSKASLCISAHLGELIIASKELHQPDDELEFSTLRDIDDVEFVIRVQAETILEFSSFYLRRIDTI